MMREEDDPVFVLHMSILPNELLLLALAQLPLNSVCVASSVCSHWRKLIVDNDRHLFATDMLLLFPLMNPISVEEKDDSYRLRFLRAGLGREKSLPNQIIHTRLFYELQLLDQEPPTVDIDAVKIDADNRDITIHNNELIPANMEPLFAEDIICRQWATDQSSVSYIRDKMLVRNGIETDLTTGEAVNKLSHYDLRKCYIDTMCIFSVGDRTYVVRLKSPTSKCLSAQMSGDALYCIISDHQWTVVRATVSGEQTEVVIGDQELTPLLQVLHGHVFVEQPSVSYTSTVYYVDMDSRISYKLYRTDGMGSGLPCAVLDGFIYVYYGVDRRRSNYAAKTLFATQTLIAMLAIATIAFVVDSSTVWILVVAFVAAAKDIHRALYAFYNWARDIDRYNVEQDTLRFGYGDDVYSKI
ncbi:hypothetical protein CJU89_3922 [Yarrowia sp. B02]|nr:hypothetical protein CJU89_3922 [Yarrowia sp. B02]